jgi:hypothetical protein
MDEQVLIANALYSDNLTDLAAMDSLFSFSPVKARIGYALSRSAVDYFLNLYNPGDMLKIIQLLSENKSADQAFKRVTGKDFIDFEIGWFAYIDEQYRWMILLNASNLVWLLLVILFVAAFIRIKLKNRKTIRSWPETGIDDMDVEELN